VKKEILLGEENLQMNVRELVDNARNMVEIARNYQIQTENVRMAHKMAL